MKHNTEFILSVNNDPSEISSSAQVVINVAREWPNFESNIRAD